MPPRTPRHAPLTPDQQAELVTKLRYGIGLEQLVGQRDAAAIRQRLPRSHRADRPTAEAPQGRAPDPEATSRAVARLGRGHGLGRRWGGW